MKLYAFEDDQLTANFFFETSLRTFSSVGGDLINIRRNLESREAKHGNPHASSAWELTPIVVLRSQRLNHSGDWFQFVDVIDDFHTIEMPLQDGRRSLMVFAANGDGSFLGEVATLEQAMTISQAYEFEPALPGEP